MMKGRRPARRSFPTPSCLPGWGARSSGCWHEHTALGMAYRVDMRLRPDGEQGAMARSLELDAWATT